MANRLLSESEVMAMLATQQAQQQAQSQQPQNRLLMQHQATQTPFQQFAQEFPQTEAFGRKVVTGGFLRENLQRFDQALANARREAFEGLPPETDDNVLDFIGFGTIASKINPVKVSSVLRGDVVEIGKIETPKEFRGKGFAEKKLNEILEQADKEGLKVALTPSSDFGASKSKLVKWYKRHGFVSNKGRNKDFSTRETLIRTPKQR